MLDLALDHHATSASSSDHHPDHHETSASSSNHHDQPHASINHEALLQTLAGTAADVIVREAVLHHHARGRSMTIDHFRTRRRADGRPMRVKDTIRAFKALRAAGCGRFTYGRRGLKSRFDWHVNPDDIARIILPPEELAALIAERQSRTLALAASRPAAGPATFAITFPLRHDFNVAITLPRDLSTDERKRLALAISALPAA